MTGIDNVSSTTIVTLGGTTTITDLAGHTTTIYFSRYRVQSSDIDIRMNTIQYDNGTTTPLTGVRLNYAWTTSSGVINSLDADARSGNARLRGTFFWLGIHHFSICYTRNI